VANVSGEAPTNLEGHKGVNAKVDLGWVSDLEKAPNPNAKKQHGNVKWCLTVDCG
jgi:hypothetical protein